MRVLLVEDDRRLAASMQRGLGESGLAVDVIHDGPQGVAAGLSTPYDVIVLDVMLPGRDGFEVCRELRQQRVNAPILMLTARDAIDDRVRGLEGGADDYMVKPFAIRELIARIRALARRHLPDRTALLTAGAIALDTAAHRLTVNGREVELTAKEFAILDFFLRHPGQLLSRTQIIENVEL
jgi:two-component system OmpR family response regulator